MYCSFLNTVLMEYVMTLYKEAKYDSDVIQNKKHRSYENSCNRYSWYS